MYFVSEGRISKPATFLTENDAHNFVLESAVELFTAANIILGACRLESAAILISLLLLSTKKSQKMSLNV